MSQDREPELVFVFDEKDSNTHHPAATLNDIPRTIEKDGETIEERITVLRKYLKLVVRNRGNIVAENCKVSVKVIIPDRDKAENGSDNFLRYPSTEAKIIMWNPYGHETIWPTTINVGEDMRLHLIVADDDHKSCPIQEAPKRVASLATPYAISKPGRNGLRVEDSFHPGEYDMEVHVTSNLGSADCRVSVHIDADNMDSVITNVVPIGESAVSLALDEGKKRKKNNKKSK